MKKLLIVLGLLVLGIVLASCGASLENQDQEYLDHTYRIITITGYDFEVTRNLCTSTYKKEYIGVHCYDYESNNNNNRSELRIAASYFEVVK